jgi:hypothetical protein
MDSIGSLLSNITLLFSLIAGLVTGLWAYTKYVLERGFLPPVKFYLTGEKVGTVNNKNIIDIKIHLHNIGSSTLIARNIRLDIRYIIAKNETLELFKDQRKAGRLSFPESVTKDAGVDPSALIPIKIRKDERKLDYWLEQGHRGFLVLENDTFVQAGVDQVYTFVTMVPGNALCCLAWCSFQYAQNLSSWQDLLSKISRKLGLIQYTLKHAIEDHTVEDVFWIEDNTKSKIQPDGPTTHRA